MTLDQYVAKTFTSRWNDDNRLFPKKRFAADKMVPTETENIFAGETTQGDVHDEGASMFGGVAGHAGLFSDAYIFLCFTKCCWME